MVHEFVPTQMVHEQVNTGCSVKYLTFFVCLFVWAFKILVCCLLTLFGWREKRIFLTSKFFLHNQHLFDLHDMLDTSVGTEQSSSCASFFCSLSISHRHTCKVSLSSSHTISAVCVQGSSELAAFPCLFADSVWARLGVFQFGSFW